jgi:GNAT superfamily N-acetyltransferase
MLQLHIYDSSAELPRALAGQIRSALLAEWPGSEADDTGGLLLGPEWHPTYFVLADEDGLRSYARTVWARVVHQAQHFKLYGLGDVLTVPQHRCQGYGGRIVQEATAHIRSDPTADAAVLLTQPKLAALYRRSGWEEVPGLQVMSGGCDGHVTNAILPMMMFLSAAAQSARARFAGDTLVLPGDEW